MSETKNIRALSRQELRIHLRAVDRVLRQFEDRARIDVAERPAFGEERGIARGRLSMVRLARDVLWTGIEDEREPPGGPDGDEVQHKNGNKMAGGGP